MKLTPAAATSTCTSPAPGAGTSCSRTCRTSRSPGSDTKTLVAVVMPATLRPSASRPAGGGAACPEPHEEVDLVREGVEQVLGPGHRALVGQDADADRV